MRRFFLTLISVSGLLFFLVVGFVAYEYSRLPDVSSLKNRNPKTTAFIELRNEQYRQNGLRPVRRQSWAPYRAISDHLKKSVIISEDAAFFSHKGIDFYELKEAIRRDWETGELTRGGSTITMQLARNLYLSPSKNPLRKLREIAIAWKLERALSKQRIFELYLNVIEWGEGIYGVQAAALHYFSKPASDLNVVEAATLAAIVPNPRNARSNETLYRRNVILSRLARIGYISGEEFDQARQTPLFYKGGFFSILPSWLRP